MKWFKVYAEIIHDPKIRALAFEDRWHFVALMALTCDGTLDEPADLRDELVSVALGLHGIDLEKAKARLMRLRLISDDWKPSRWDKRQASADPTGAERQRRWKENLAKSKAKQSPAVSNGVSNGSTNAQNIEVRSKKDSSYEESSARTREKFKPPTAEDVQRYCRETGHHIDAERFIDHYTANGWRVGKVPMKSWQHAVAGWWRRDQDKAIPRGGTRARSIADDLTDRSWANA